MNDTELHDVSVALRNYYVFEENAAEMYGKVKRLAEARERLEAIVKFFETRCPQCKEHYCPECTERLGKMIVEAAEFLAELPNG